MTVCVYVFNRLNVCVYIHVHRYVYPHNYVCICTEHIEYVGTFMCIGVHTHANATTSVLICVCVCVYENMNVCVHNLMY